MNVEQENFFCRDLRVGPAAAEAVGHELRHRVGEVGVDRPARRRGIRRRGLDADRSAAVEEHFLHLLAEREGHAQLAGDAGHAFA